MILWGAVTVFIVGTVLAPYWPEIRLNLWLLSSGLGKTVLDTITSSISVTFILQIIGPVALVTTLHLCAIDSVSISVLAFLMIATHHFGSGNNVETSWPIGGAVTAITGAMMANSLDRLASFVALQYLMMAACVGGCLTTVVASMLMSADVRGSVRMPVMIMTLGAASCITYKMVTDWTAGWTEDEDRIIIEEQEKPFPVNNWALIAERLPGRTATMAENYWNDSLHDRVVR